MNFNDIRKFKASFLLGLMLFTAKGTKAYASQDDTGFSVKVDGEPVYASELYDTLCNLPEGIKEYLTEKELNVVLLDDAQGAEKRFEKAYGYKTQGISGFVLPKKNTIYVESSKDAKYYELSPEISEGYLKDEFNYMIVKDTLIHELGHFFDLKEDFDLSNSDEFADIYESEASNYLNTTHFNLDNLGMYINISTTAEYFATAYACYMRYPEELKEYCPRTYEYINNYMNKIISEYTDEEENNIQIDRYTRVRRYHH